LQDETVASYSPRLLKAMTEPVGCELVSWRNSLPTGKRTGNFEKIWLAGRKSSKKQTGNQWVERQFPTITNRELFRANRESRTRKRSEQGIGVVNFVLFESAHA
jgi:hypothetical protein